MTTEHDDDIYDDEGCPPPVAADTQMEEMDNEMNEEL